MRGYYFKEKAININLGLLFLRLGLGFLMLFAHGIQKLQMLLSGSGYDNFPDILHLGPLTSLVLVVLSEFLCSIFIVIGLKTRFALIPLIITMLIAVFFVHAGDVFAKKELAVIYLLGYLTLIFTGGGSYAISRD